MKRLNVIACTAAASFLDIVDLFVRLTPKDRNQSLPEEYRIFDNLYAEYSTLMDASVQVHGACAKYLLCCRHSPVPPTEPDPTPNFNGTYADSERDVEGAFREVRRGCEEMKKVVTELIDCWDTTVSKVLSDGRRLPIQSLWQLASAVAPDCGPIRRQALFADLPSIRANSQLNVRAFGDAYEGLEVTMAEIHITRTAALAVDTPLELPNHFQIALLALRRLESVFERYRLGLDIANRDLGQWSKTLTDPVYRLLAAEEKRTRSA
ncbi:hypothetical protein DFH06DRAFT_496923 [Mycena polygramma]|nr:hypothetical protein DFH06DRAFT_496923 [Mycena polygramma]